MGNKPITIEDIMRVRAEMEKYKPAPVTTITWHWWMDPAQGLIEFTGPTGKQYIVGHPQACATVVIAIQGSDAALDFIGGVIRDHIKERANQMFAKIDQAFQDWEYKIYKDETPF